MVKDIEEDGREPYEVTDWLTQLSTSLSTSANILHRKVMHLKKFVYNCQLISNHWKALTIEMFSNSHHFIKRLVVTLVCAHACLSIINFIVELFYHLFVGKNNCNYEVPLRILLYCA